MEMELIGQGSEASYNYYVQPYENKFAKITLDDNDLAVIKERARSIALKKARESQNIGDTTSLLKRWITGWCGERVAEKYLGLNFIDLTIGESYDYNQPDLLKAGYRVGVKTCNVKDFPLMKPPSPSHHNQPQIFVIKVTKNNYYVAGLGDYGVVNNPKNYTPFLVRSNAIRHKRAFYRFDLLNHNFSMKDLEQFRANPIR